MDPDHRFACNTSWNHDLAGGAVGEVDDRYSLRVRGVNEIAKGLICQQRLGNQARGNQRNEKRTAATSSVHRRRLVNVGEPGESVGKKITSSCLESKILIIRRCECENTLIDPEFRMGSYFKLPTFIHSK